MKINWKIRAKNKTFWMLLIPLLFLFVQQVAGLFGYALDLNATADKLVEIAETVFLVLGLLGVVVDTTTEGLADSERALGYIKPGIGQEEDNDA